MDTDVCVAASEKCCKDYFHGNFFADNWINWRINRMFGISWPKPCEWKEVDHCDSNHNKNELCDPEVMAHCYSHLVNIAVEAIVFNNCLFISQLNFDFIIVVNYIDILRQSIIAVFVFTDFPQLLQLFVFFLSDYELLIKNIVSNLLREFFLLVFPVLVVNFGCENALEDKYHQIKSPNQCKRVVQSKRKQEGA